MRMPRLVHAILAVADTQRSSNGAREIKIFRKNDAINIATEALYTLQSNFGLYKFVHTNIKISTFSLFTLFLHGDVTKQPS